MINSNQTKHIPFYRHEISEATVSAVVETLRSGWISTGSKVNDLAREIEKQTQTSHSQMVNSATAGLMSTLKIWGVGYGDEVITTAYTFCATANVILQLGAIPVLCDIGEDMNIDPKEIQKKITSKTKAIIPVDMGGLPCDYSSIYKVVLEKSSIFQPKNEFQKALGRIMVLCDGAHSFGSSQKGMKVGTIGDITVFSFHVVKNITTSDGGAIVSCLKEPFPIDLFFQKLKQFTLHGMDKNSLERISSSGYEYDINIAGYKFNMTDIEASLGIEQLKLFDQFYSKRKELVLEYKKQLKDNQNIDLWRPVETESPSEDLFYHLFPIFLKQKWIPFRKKIIEKMEKEKGISCNIHFKPLPLLSLYKSKGYSIEDYPKSQYTYQREITLPLYTQLTMSDIFYITTSLKEVIEELE